VWGKLQEYMDDQLPDEEVQAMQTHLLNCVACRQELALLRQVDDALATYPLQNEPADFTARVIARAGRSEMTPHRDVRPVFRLRWQDTLLSFGFALAMTCLLVTLTQLQQGAPAVKLASHQAWRIWHQNVDRLSHLVRTEPAFAAWGLSSLCTITASVTGIAALVRRWPRRRSGRLAAVSKKR
jgi:anti-sigma factor RsiW